MKKGARRKSYSFFSIPARKSSNIKEFQKFRDLIRALVEKVIKDAYRVRNLNMNRKTYNVVAKINEELDSLYRDIIAEQKNHIAIANKVMRLKGLVLNLIS